MAVIVPERPMIDATELLTWYEREQRDLPWRRPGVTPWQVLVS
jgi:A/G-specific adenine glycosylase